MEKIIALCGKQNSGKTTTLNRLINLWEVPDKIIKYTNTDKDRMVFYENHQGKRIVIGTAGDDDNAIIQALLFAIVNNCDILILAYSTTGEENIHNSIVCKIHSVLEHIIKGAKEEETLEKAKEKWLYKDKKHTPKVIDEIIGEIDVIKERKYIDEIKQKASKIDNELESIIEKSISSYEKSGSEVDYEKKNREKAKEVLKLTRKFISITDIIRGIIKNMIFFFCKKK